MSFVPTSISLIIAPGSPPPLASSMTAPKGPKCRCTCLPKVEDPNVNTEENSVMVITPSAPIPLIGT